jgi:hypothetical protein
MTAEARGTSALVRWLLTANGLLLPFLVFQMYYHPLIWIAALWAVTFPGSTCGLALLFHRECRSRKKSSPLAGRHSKVSAREGEIRRPRAAAAVVGEGVHHRRRWLIISSSRPTTLARRFPAGPVPHSSPSRADSFEGRPASGQAIFLLRHSRWNMRANPHVDPGKVTAQSAAIQISGW